MVAETRKALRITTTSFDDEILDLLRAGVKDVKNTGCSFDAFESANDITIPDPYARRTVIMYVQCNFGQPDDYARIKSAYDEMKAQMRENSDYSEG